MKKEQKEKSRIVAILDRYPTKYKIHQLPSGVILIDIWHNENFFVIQLEKNVFGLSEINAGNPGFDTIPDERFKNFQELENRLLIILSQ